MHQFSNSQVTHIWEHHMCSTSLIRLTVIHTQLIHPTWPLFTLHWTEITEQLKNSKLFTTVQFIPQNNILHLKFKSALKIYGYFQNICGAIIHWQRSDRGNQLLSPKLYFTDVINTNVTTTVTSNGSWCMGIKGEMSGTVCVTFTWYMYIYELFTAFVCFVICSLL